MALLTPPSAGQLTAIRSNNHYRAIQFICLVPNDVVVRFQPSAAPTTSVYAEITVGSVGTGSMANIKEGQTVIYSTTTDHTATEVFRTRVRKVSGTATLYIGECSQALTTAMYVTVLNTYELHEKLRRSATAMDWEITFRKLLPIETALPSAVVVSNGGTSYAPTAVPQEMDESATPSFTHAWESSNSNDSIANGTTASPTITLQAAAFRWLRYTFTDSNGNSNFRVIPCWTVPKNYSSQVATGFVGENGDLANISHDAELGWSATIPAFSGIENVLNKTLCVIASDEWYNDTRQTIRGNINFVGYLQNENTATSGDDAIGKDSETTFSIEGIGQQLARLNVASATIIQVADIPVAFDEIQNPTPARMLTYHLTENTTLFNLCSMTIPADDTDFIGDDFTISNGKALDDCRTISEVVNAELQFDSDGRLDLCRNLVFLDDTARDAAATIVEFVQGDFSNHAIDYDYAKQTASLHMTGGVYSSSLDTYVLYEADAPAVARLSEGDALPISNQVLTTDSSATQALDEIGQRAANFFAAHNPTWTLRCALNDEWHFLVPDVGVWFTFPLAEEDTARGKVFSSSDRWQLITISHTTNTITGRKQVDATFRLETQSTGAMVRAAQIQNSTIADILYFPATTLEYSGIPTEDGTWYDSQDTQAPSIPTPPDGECELGGLRIRSGVPYITSNVIAGNGELMSILVRGSGIIGATGDGWCHELDFTASDNGFEVDPVRPFGNYVGGSGWEHEDGTAFGTSARRINIRKTAIGISPFDCTRIEVDFSLTKGTYSPSNSVVIGIASVVGDTQASWRANNPVVVDGNNQTLGVDAGVGTQFHFSQFYFFLASSVGSFGGSITLHKVRFMGDGANPFGADTCTPEGDAFPVKGDAFYYTEDDWANATAYDVGEGCLIEAAQPDAIPPFSPTHEYAIYQECTSGPVSISFNSPFALSAAENWSIQAVVCNSGIFP